MNRTIIVSLVVLLLVLSIAGFMYMRKSSTQSTESSQSTQPTQPIQNTTTKPSTVVKAPALLDNKIQWQGNCTGDGCGGLVWQNIGKAPWNKYYQMSCVASNGEESAKTQIFGPVNNGSWNNPKIRVQADGVSPCEAYSKLKVYSGTNSGNLVEIHPKNFNNTGEYNGTDATFWDM